MCPDDGSGVELQVVFSSSGLKQTCLAYLEEAKVPQVAQAFETIQRCMTEKIKA